MTIVSTQDALELIIRLEIKLFMHPSPSRSRAFLSLKTQAKDTTCSGGCVLKGVLFASTGMS